MPFWFIAVFLSGLLAPPLHANMQDAAGADAAPPVSVATEFKKILAHLDKLQADLRKKFAKASDAEKEKIYADYQNSVKRALGDAFKLAKNNPKDPAAVDALVWVATPVLGPTLNEDQRQAIDILLRDHIDSKQLEQLCITLSYTPDGKALQALQTILAKTTNHDLKGFACFGLACNIKNHADEYEAAGKPQTAETYNEAKKLFNRVINEFRKLTYSNQNLANLAKRYVFEIENLTIGKVAPNIEGTDSDGKHFKLSDYRGKVVVLDFWAEY
jgi:hypothetical protein